MITNRHSKRKLLAPEAPIVRLALASPRFAILGEALGSGKRQAKAPPPAVFCTSPTSQSLKTQTPRTQPPGRFQQENHPRPPARRQATVASEAKPARIDTQSSGCGNRNGSHQAPIAQLVEQRTLNPRVVGSSPTGRIRKTQEKSWFFLRFAFSLCSPI